MNDHVIQFAHRSQDSPWDSDESSMDTSTPEFKRGNHGDRQTDSYEKIRELIRKESIAYKLPCWMKKNRRSVHILANHHFGEYPIGTMDTEAKEAADSAQNTYHHSVFAEIEVD